MTPEDLAVKLTTYTTKELISEVKRRQHGAEPFTVDRLEGFLNELSLSDLSALKDRILHLWDYRSSLIPTFTEEEAALLANKDFMGCVRSIRERTSLGLVDAKKLMDRWRGKAHG